MNTEVKTVDSETAAAATTTPKNWPKHALWLGFVVSFVGMVSYFLYFAQFPELRDVPLLNSPIVLLGVLLCGAGCVQVLRHSASGLGKVAASVTFLLTLGVAGLFHTYIFYISYQLPAAADAPASAAAAPLFALQDQNDQTVSLADYRGDKVVVVFYRGHW